MEKLSETLFNIELFLFEEALPFEEGIQYTEIEFKFDSLKKYNGCAIEVNQNWDITVWTIEGEQIDKFNLIEIEDFKEELRKKL